MTTSHKPSIGIIMDELRDLSIAVLHKRNELSQAIEERNDLMVELMAAGIPAKTIEKLTGLGRDSVALITKGARKARAVQIAHRLEESPLPDTRQPRIRNKPTPQHETPGY